MHLHSGSLLWSRDLLVRGGRGLVDIPRLIESQVALQAFTVVTKTPRDLNFPRNTADSDNILLLSLAVRWPPATWSSFAKRALYACAASNPARRVSSRSSGPRRTCTPTSTAGADPAITVGFLGIEGAHALDGNLANIDRLCGGFRRIAPTHLFNNDIGSSSAGVDKTRLTNKGREMVRRMEAGHMRADPAHDARRIIDDVLAALAPRPLLISHTGRVIGIANIDEAVCGKDGTAIARAIGHAADTVGVDAGHSARISTARS